MSVEATDSRGQTVAQSKSYAVQPNQPPQVSAWATPEPLVAGRPVNVCVTASDEVQVSSLTLRLGSQVLWNCGNSCSTESPRCFVATVPVATSVEVRAEATDPAGLISVSTMTYPIQPNPPPTVQVRATPEPLTAGTPFSACVLANDDVQVSGITLRVGSQVVWNCNASCPMNSERCFFVGRTGRRLNGDQRGRPGWTGTDRDRRPEHAVARDLQPPTVEFTPYMADYLVVGQWSYLAARATDNAHLATLRYEGHGRILDQWVASNGSPITQLTYYGYYLPDSETPLLLRASATDGVGQTSWIERLLPVFRPAPG